MYVALRGAVKLGCLATLVFVLTSVPAEAAKRRIEIRNNTPNTIYRVTGWAADFLPNGFNLMPLVLRANERRVVEVNDDYNKCLFNFVVDFRNPRQKYDIRRLARTPPKPKWYQDINLCVGDAKTLDVKP